MSFGFGFGFPKRLTSGGGLSPRLYLDFVGTGSLPSTVTFSRGTNATLTDSNGRTAWAPHNLLTNSEDFEAAAWVKTNATVTANSTVAPDGTTTADSFIEDTTLGEHRFVQTTATAVTIGSRYTYSFYVKANGRNSLRIYSFAFNNYTTIINFETGVVFSSSGGTSPSISSVPVGNGWYRLVFSDTATAASLDAAVILVSGTSTFNYTGNGTSGIFIWGAQLNVANAPVNLLTWSEQFDNAAWIQAAAGINVQANVVAAPDGTLTADKLVEDVFLNHHRRGQAISLTVNGRAFVYAKAAERTFLRMWSFAGGDTSAQFFDLAAGIASGTLSPTITPVGNGWYKCECSVPSVHTTFVLGPAPNNTIATAPYTGDGTSGVYVWGAQLNTGSVALPYVATTSSIYLPPAYNSTTPKNLLGFTQEPENAAWTKSNSYVQQNLLTWSQQIGGTNWSRAAASESVTLNNAIAPDGTLTASLISRAGTTTWHGYRQSATVSASTVYTVSMYVKSNTGSPGVLAAGGVVVDFQVAVVNGVSTIISDVGSSPIISHSAVNVGSGWFRVVVTFNTSSLTSVSIGTCDGSAVSAASNWYWGAQLVQGSTAGDYTQTTSAAAPTRYLNFDGTLTGRKLVETTANAQHSVFQAQTLTAGTYTLSVYAKADQGPQRWLQLYPQGTGVTAAAVFDINAGTVSFTTGAQLISSAIVSVGGGWYRCSVTFTGAAVSVTNVLYLSNVSNLAAPAYTGDGTSGIYVSDFQLSNSASVDPYVYNPQAAAASAAYYGPRFDYNPTGTPVLGPQLVTNGDFSGGTTGWTQDANGLLSVVGGSLRVENGSALNSAAYQSFTTVVNSLYRASIQNTGATNLQVRIGTSAVGSQNYVATISAGASSTFEFTATATTTFVAARVLTATLGDFILVDNVSVQLVTGYTATANGLLIEEQRTNLLTYSEQFDNVAWTKSTSSVTANATVAPDGATTADKFIKNNGVDGQIYGTNTASVVSGTTYTISLFAKEAEWNFIKVAGGGAAFGNNGVTVNLSTGQIVATDVGVTGTATSVGNGWWRITATRAASASGIGDLVVFSGTSSSVNTVGNGTAGIFIWGAQLEAGAFPTSYIPTVASQVTRNADSALILGDNFYNFYNPNAGSMTASFQGYTVANSNQAAFGFDNGTPGSNIICIGSGSPSTSMRAFVRSGGVSSVDITVANGGATGSVVNEGLTYNQTNANAAANGTLGTLASPVVIPGGMVRATIGYGGNTGSYLSGWYRRIGYYNTRLPDSTLTALTT